jgi:hypothetical protein
MRDDKGLSMNLALRGSWVFNNHCTLGEKGARAAFSAGQSSVSWNQIPPQSPVSCGSGAERDLGWPRMGMTTVAYVDSQGAVQANDMPSEVLDGKKC